MYQRVNGFTSKQYTDQILRSRNQSVLCWEEREKGKKGKGDRSTKRRKVVRGRGKE